MTGMAIVLQPGSLLHSGRTGLRQTHHDHIDLLFASRDRSHDGTAVVARRDHHLVAFSRRVVHSTSQRRPEGALR